MHESLQTMNSVEHEALKRFRKCRDNGKSLGRCLSDMTTFLTDDIYASLVLRFARIIGRKAEDL